MLLRSLIALLQFTTVLPLGRMQDFECFARRSYLYPVAGYVIGGISAIAIFFIGEPLIAAALAIALLFLLSGCNHLDGLMDFGDGLMAHGGREARIRALTDRQIGTGGISMGVSVTLISFAALSSSPCIACSLIAGEVGAKFSMAFLSAYGSPFREGIHATIQSRSRPYFPLLAALLCIPLALLPFRPLALGLAAAAMVLCPLLLLTISERLFGGVNGDLVGAGNEITRAFVMVALALG